MEPQYTYLHPMPAAIEAHTYQSSSQRARGVYVRTFKKFGPSPTPSLELNRPCTLCCCLPKVSVRAVPALAGPSLESVVAGAGAGGFPSLSLSPALARTKTPCGGVASSKHRSRQQQLPFDRIRAEEAI